MGQPGSFAGDLGKPSTTIMKPLRPILSFALVLGHSPAAETRPATKPANLLFIMTDLQRWDVMSCAGDPVIKKPNRIHVWPNSGRPVARCP